MAKTHDLGKFYWHTLVYPIKPPVVFDRAETQQIEHPYHAGKGWAVRLPLTRLAIVIGRYTQTFSESVALTRAINGRVIDEQVFDWDTIRGIDEDL